VVFRPPTLSKGGEMIHSKISVLSDILNTEIQSIAKAQNLDLLDAKTSDDRLFPLLKIYYQTIFDLLVTPPVGVERICQSDRYEFFVTQGKKTIGGEIFLSQSKLSWLLGNEEKKEISTATEIPADFKTTGDFILDVIGRALVFLQKGQAIDLLTCLSPEEALKAMSYAGQILAEAMQTEEEKNVSEPIVNYAMDSATIEEKRNQGLNLPEFSE
jgi:hypothetical protein